MQSQDGRREQGRVDRPGLADGQRADRNTARHLHDRQQRIDTLQGARLHRHAQHRQARLGGGHARQMSRPAGPGDDDLDAPPGRLRRVLEQQIRRAVSGHHPALVGNAQRRQRVAGMAQRVPVAARPHDDADPRRRAVFLLHGSPGRAGRRKKAPDGTPRRRAID